MRKLTVSLLALPLLLAGAAHADSDHMKMDPAQMHQDMCLDRYAHSFAKTAYLQARLGITDQQQAAWDAWQKTELDSAAKERDTCLSTAPKKGHDDSILDQESRLETMLSTKLDELRASRPALEALYATLSSDQKDEFDHFGEQMHHQWHGPQGEHHEDGHDGH
jgi:hypothetical protein